MNRLAQFISALALLHQGWSIIVPEVVKIDAQSIRPLQESGVPVCSDFPSEVYRLIVIIQVVMDGLIN